MIRQHRKDKIFYSNRIQSLLSCLIMQILLFFSHLSLVIEEFITASRVLFRAFKLARSL